MEARAEDDAALFGRVARGESSALRALYDRHGGRTLAIALRLLAQRSEAEEVVQETFVEVWRRAREYDPGRGSAASYIATIARTRALDRLRARRSAERTAQAAALEETPPPASPLESSEQRQDRERVLAALSALPDEQRLVIECAYYRGLSLREIAERTGEPLGTVKSRVRLAMAKLEALLLAREQGEPQ